MYAPTAARRTPTPVLFRDFRDDEIAILRALAPGELSDSALIEFEAETGAHGFAFCMRPDQARSMAISLAVLADYADELQTIADEIAQQVQP